MKHKHQTLSDMVLFVEVARCGSFRLAAARLEMPVATLSRRIAGLEKRLGVQLLVRTTRTVAVTQLAQPYFEQCQKVLEAVDEAQSVLTSDVATPAQRIRMSMPVDLGVDILGSIVAAYAKTQPQLRVDLDLSSAAKDLFRDPVDLVFRIGRPMDDRVVARKVGQLAAAVYASAALLKLYGQPKIPADLRAMPCLELMTAKGPMGWGSGFGDGRSAPGQVSLSANSVGLLRVLAEQGHGFALLPRHQASQSVLNGSLVEVLSGQARASWPVYACTASRSVSGAVRGLIAHVRSHWPDAV
jgi:DNA-binding transcriptional LysR family regulator